MKLYQGFTLTELLVVIGVIAILASLLLSAVMAGKASASRAACQSNLRQIGLALTMYLDRESCFPSACNMPSTGLSPLPGISEAMANEVDGAKQVFACPSDSQYYRTEGTSYEWSTFLNGRSRANLKKFGHALKEEEVRVLWDYEAFHGPDDKPESRNLLLLSTVVRKL